MAKGSGYFSINAKMLAVTAVMAAIGAIFEFLPLDLPFPPLPFLTFDPSGIPTAIAALAFGPISGTLVAIVMTLTIFLRGNVLGSMFKFVAEFFTAIPLSIVLWIFRNKYKERSHMYLQSMFLLGLIVGMVCRVATMALANYMLLPIFYGMPESAVVALLPMINFFNAIAALIAVVPAWIIVLVLPPDLKPEWLDWKRG